LLLAASEATRAEVTAKSHFMRLKLTQYYSDKFDYLFHGVRYAIGSFYCTQGGSEHRAREILSAVLDEVDVCVARGKADQLDRVTRTYFMPGTVVRREAELFIERTSTHYTDYHRLYVGMQIYALIPFASRRVERLHGTIKRQGSHAYGIQVPHLCSQIREAQNLQTVREDAEFKSFCLSNWRSTKLIDELLVMRVGREELQQLSYNAKVRLVYQCSLVSEYGDQQVASASYKDFTRQVVAVREPDVKFSEGRGCVWIGLKARFARAVFIACRSLYSTRAWPICLRPYPGQLTSA
jgi:hypothetical protein